MNYKLTKALSKLKHCHSNSTTIISFITWQIYSSQSQLFIQVDGLFKKIYYCFNQLSEELEVKFFPFEFSEHKDFLFFFFLFFL